MTRLFDHPNFQWPPKECDAVLAAIGRIVFNFNTCERTITQMLNVLIGGDHHAVIVTAHMGTNTQLDALRTLAAEYQQADQREHIAHSIKLFERVRERRNYYIHSYAFVPGNPGPTAGMQSWSARGRLKIHKEVVTAETLENEARMIMRATEYLALVHNHFSMPDDLTYQTLPERFPLPDALTKPFEYAQDAGYQPRSYPR
ncbi:MAG: hypothetical protein V4475_07795 [Pseudomonadota bacterium]